MSSETTRNTIAGRWRKLDDTTGNGKVARIRATPSAAIDSLIDAITTEMDRVWREDGFEGTSDDYVWLFTYYGITEDEDVEWVGICDYYGDGISPEDEEGEDWLEFVCDEQSVHTFLEKLLQKYRSNTTTHNP